MALTFTSKQNGWLHPYTSDAELDLRDAGTAITSDTNGSTVSNGFTPGGMAVLLVDIDSADWSSNEDYFVHIQYYDGSSWYDIQGANIHPQFLTSTSPDSYQTGLYHAHFHIPNAATGIRYRVDVEGSAPSIDCAIKIRVPV